MLLQNSEINLRALEPEDLTVLYRWENTSDLWIYGNTLTPYSKMALRQYISDAMQYDIFQNKQLRLMIELQKEGTVIGTIDMYEFDIHNRRAGIGILVDKPYQNRGYALQVLELIEEYAFSFLQLQQLFAHIGVNNILSLKLFEKAKYQQIGVLKDWIRVEDSFEDVAIVQLLNRKE